MGLFKFFLGDVAIQRQLAEVSKELFWYGQHQFKIFSYIRNVTINIILFTYYVYSLNDM